MQTINCHVPLKLKLSGLPSEDDWAALEHTLTEQYILALRRSLEESRFYLARPSEAHTWPTSWSGSSSQVVDAC